MTRSFLLILFASLPRHVHGEPFDPVVRVNLTPAPVESAALKADADLIVQTSAGRVGSVTSGRFHVRTNRAGFIVNDTRFASRAIELQPRKSPGFWFGNHLYRGGIRLIAGDRGRFSVINTVRLSEYLASVVDSEMPTAFGAEARKAQAVVARTFALYHLSRRHPLFDVYATSRSQHYLGAKYWTKAKAGYKRRLLAGESDSSREVVRATAGIVLTRNGKLCCTLFHACCGGRTREGKNTLPGVADWQRGVRCGYCKACDKYRWIVRVSNAELRRRINSYLSSNGSAQLRGLDIADGTTCLTVQDSTQTVRIRKNVVRKLILPSLSSTKFRIGQRKPGNDWIFSGAGHGHGAGMCQWGARGLAANKKSYREILRYYYPNAQLARMPARHGMLDANANK